jgi:Mg-chelatase subunit ChlD
MMLLSPIWLVLLVPAGLCLAAWPPPRGPQRWLGAVVWLALVAALAAPVLRLPGRNGVLVVVADRSESMPAAGLAAQAAQIGQLDRQRGPGETLAVVSFRQDAAVEMRPGEGGFGGFRADTPGGMSNLHDALARALDLIPADARGRILVLSDGEWSGADPAAAAAQAALRGIGIDYQQQQRAPGTDLAVLELQGPESVGSNEGFLLTAWYSAPASGPVRYELRRDGTPIAQGTAEAVQGRNRLLFRDQGGTPGVVDYTLRLSADVADAVPENNAARLLVGVQGPRPLLLLRPGAASGLAATLRASGLEVTEMSPGAAPLGLAELSRYTAVVLENVPARTVGTDTLHAIAAWVQVAGGGLMLTGGEQSYGQGGYLNSPVDSILPLSLEIRREHRKMSLAIAIALDRSGSMAAAAGNGRSKMDMANLGAVEVIRLLADMDHVGVIAVDSSAHEVLPLSPVTDARAGVGKVLSIESSGGGIFVYEALRQAAAMVARAPQKNRHIILFADAADAEEPGGYVPLISTCREAGVTISVVGLGTESDRDAALLRDVAERGGGRVFFSARPEELPAIFAQETFAVTGSSFSDQPGTLQFGAPWLTLGGLPVAAGPVLDGYNICFLKPDALLAAATLGEDPSPAVAFWQAGAGRVLCYTGEADGPYGRSLAAWPRAGEFFATLGRWTAGSAAALPDGMVATRRVRAGLCTVDVYLDPERATTLAALPRLHWVHSAPGRPPTVESRPLHWSAPDQLSAEQPLHAAETVLPVLELPGGRRLALPPACLPYSQEFAPAVPGRGGAALRRLADATGGREVPDLSSLWRSLPRARRAYALQPLLFIMALSVLLLGVLQRRTGWPRWPQGRPGRPLAPAPAPAGRRDAAAESELRRPPVAAPEAPAAPVPQPESAAAPRGSPPPPPATPSATRPDPLREARDRAQRRTRR